MQIRFKLFGLTDVIGESEVRLELPPGSNLIAAVRMLVGTCGDALGQRLLRPDGQLQDYVRLVVAGRVVDRLEEEVEEGATIFILREIAGG